LTAGPTTTPVPFDQRTVTLRYQIPALGLDRSLEGNLGGQMVWRDASAGTEAPASNQTAVLNEVTGALLQLELAALPGECPGCVRLEYELPLVGISASGWLTDDQMLSSIENAAAVWLGPHFPPGTALGLRRSASPFAPAHSLALTADGQLWLWTAEQAVVAQPVAAAEFGLDPAGLQARLGSLGLAEAYVADCDFVPRETLFLSFAESGPGGGAGDDQLATLPAIGPRSIAIRCPELTLPADLLPLYLQMDRLLLETIGDTARAGPERLLPIAAMLHYRRPDGASLTLLQGEIALARAADGAVVTATLPLPTAGLTTTSVISLTNAALGSGRFRPGVADYLAGESANTLLARGPSDMAEAGWDGDADAALAPLVVTLDSILAAMLGETQPALTPEPSATVAPGATPTSSRTPSP
jgi:hypothetical protein